MKRLALLAVLAACSTLTFVAAASAATLTNAGGTLSYAGGDGQSGVSFEQGAGGVNDVKVTDDKSTGDNDPITSAPGCTLTGSTAYSTTYDCPLVTRVAASMGGGDDYVDNRTQLPSTQDGGAGNDEMFANSSSAPATMSGGAGNDRMLASQGNDTVDGGSGDDGLIGEGGADDIHGGSGIDSVFASDQTPATTPQDVTVTLDDQANDGTPGEGDNVHSDVEDVEATSTKPSGSTTAYGTVRLTGSAADNSLDSDGGRAVLDGGPGNDVLTGSTLDDTIEARDGYADRVRCLDGNDTVNADQFDQVGEDCETVNRTQVANANQDDPPTVAWASPAGGAKLPTTRPTTLTATAADDKGVAKVQFLAGNRLVCEATAAPYSCAYTPAGADSGKQVLTAIAIDGAQQTATAIRAVRIDRFAPRITETLTPAKDTTAPYRFRVSGTLTPPAGLSKAEACASGKVSTQVKAGTKTISTRRVDLTRTCTYSSTTSFASRARFGKAQRLKVTVRFGGNVVLAPRTLASKYVRVK